MNIALRGEYGQITWVLAPRAAATIKAMSAKAQRTLEGDIQRYLERRVQEVHGFLERGEVADLMHQVSCQE